MICDDSGVNDFKERKTYCRLIFNDEQELELIDLENVDEIE